MRDDRELSGVNGSCGHSAKVESRNLKAEIRPAKGRTTDDHKGESRNLKLEIRPTALAQSVQIDGWVKLR